MADALQPDLPSRAPQASEGLSNRTGIIEAPDVEPADSAMEDSFKELMGREPSTLDNIPDRDREKLGDADTGLASEVPDAEPIENDPDPDAEKADGEEKKSGTAEKTDVTPETKPDEGKTEGEKSFLDDLLGKEKAPEQRKPDAEPDPYDNIKLRSDASDKTKTTFEDLKRVAKEREQKAATERDEAKKSADELRKQLEEAKKTTVPEDVTAELKELREFRATFAAEQDPEFNKRFETRRQGNEQTIFEALKRNGLKDELVEQVKKLPREQQVDQIARWADKLSPREKIAIHAKLADNENVESERAAALAEIKAKAEYKPSAAVSDPTKLPETYVAEMVGALKPILQQVPFLHPKEVPDTASPKEKEDAAKHNAAAAETQQQLVSFLQDNAPRTRGLLALAGVLAPRYRQQALTAEARVAELEKELNSIKDAGRLSKTARSAGSSAKAAPRIDLDTPAEEAMDAMWKNMGGV